MVFRPLIDISCLVIPRSSESPSAYYLMHSTCQKFPSIKTIFHYQYLFLHARSLRRLGLSVHDLFKPEHSVKTIVAGIIVFVLIAAVFANIFSRAELSQIDMQINKQEKAISKLDSEITRLKCSLQSLMTYEMIEQSAVELGMQKLERRQITYVHTGNAELPDIE